MINNVVLVGRLTKDVDLRYTSSGTAVGTFALAVNRQFTNQAGEREADFINCVMWRKSAENFANFTRKGSLVGITGRIQTRNYDNQQGQRVYVTEVVADNFTLLESKTTTEQRPRETGAGSSNQAAPSANFGSSKSFESNQNQGQYNNQYSSPKQNGFSDFNSTADPFSSNGESIDISDEDLPF